MSTIQDQDPSEFLKGTRFSSAFRFDYPADQPLESRFDYIAKHFCGKRVVHVGCVDHLPVVDEKIRNNRWIHGCITRVADSCVGFDINAEGISHLQQQHGIDAVYCHDACQGPPESMRNQQWDIMFIGEVVEHIDNPVSFLNEIYERWRGSVQSLVLTVPNAFRHENFLHAKAGYELVNSDHRFWFSPFTISKLVVQAGFQNPSTRFITGFPVGNSRRPKKILHRWMVRRIPAARDTLLLTASF